MIVEATAPCRIDLAGGTLDIYPLYLFEDGGITVNAGISVRSHVRIETRDDDQIHILPQEGLDPVAVDSPDDLPLGGPTDLLCRLVRFYPPQVGVNINASCEAPRGSGLGASSSILVSLSGALNEFNGAGFKRQQLIDWGAEIEAQSIRTATGKQDYYPAMYGGLNALWFDVRGTRVEPLVVNDEMLHALEDRLLLSFTGISHFSGATNWDMMKNYIDDVGDTREHMRQIKLTALRMREVLREGDLESFSEVLDHEWQNRRSLAAGVSTPEIDAMMAAAASAGATASKLCGAGGGGCMITFIREGARAEVEAALEARGAQMIPYELARGGLEVSRRD